MKKCITVLAALCGCGYAAAQSSVTIFGVMDSAYSRGFGSVGNRSSVGTGLAGPRLGFRGTEDLGGGYSASFWLEAGIFADEGNGIASNSNNQSSGASVGKGLTFNRRSTLSLNGPFGELRLGRDYVPQYYSLAYADPFNHTAVGSAVNFTNSIAGVTGIRASNAIHYLTPAGLPYGLFAQVTHYRGENSSDDPLRSDGNGNGLRIGFAHGPIAASIGTGNTSYVAGDVRQTNANVKWTLGKTTLYSGLSRHRTGELNAKGWIIGATLSFRQHMLKAAYSAHETDATGNPRASKVALGYLYNLSKRTTLYGTVAAVSNKGGSKTALNGSITEPNRSSSGFDIGINHKF